MTHDELRDLSGGYALGALSEEDRRAFAAHVATCPECAEEVRGFATVASGLAAGVPQIDPPAALRARVLAAAVAGPPRAVTTEAPRSGRGAFMFLSVAAALVALALALYAQSLQRRIQVLEEELRLASARGADVQQQLVNKVAPTARPRSTVLARLTAAHRPCRAKGSPARPVVRSESDHGLVVAFDSPPPTAADRVYQLWVIPPGSRADQRRAAEPQPDGRAIALGAPAAPHASARSRHARARRRSAGADRRHDRRGTLELTPCGPHDNNSPDPLAADRESGWRRANDRLSEFRFVAAARAPSPQPCLAR